MDTKRCLSCRKLLRADAHSCSLCGYVFSQAPVRHSSKATNGSRRAATASIPSNPPASPHRAGHYSGLHPEDQPFQSSFMPILRPPAITRRLVEQESDEVFQPVVAPQLVPVPKHEQTPKRYVASPIRSPLPMPQRYSGTLSQMAAPVPLVEVETPPLAPEQTLHEQITAPLPVPAYLPDKRRPHNRIVPILLLASCLSFLLATSIGAYLVLDRRAVTSTHPVLTAAPNVMRLHDSFLLSGSAFQANEPMILTRDAGITLNDSKGKPFAIHTDSRGNFAIQILITENWNAGIHTIYANVNEYAGVSTTITVQQTLLAPPKLQLSDKEIDFGTNVLGAISTKTITLTNAGGGQIDWQAGSDSSWLSILPAGGTFYGSKNATLTGNRANLAPGDHTGYITFIQQGNTYSTLKVTIAVSPHAATVTVSPPTTVTVGPPPVPGMVITPNALTFHAIQGTNPAPQPITITNPGNAPLNWAITEDANATTYISIFPTHAVVAAGSSATITVAPKVSGATTSVVGHITISDTDKGTPVKSQQ